MKFQCLQTLLYFLFRTSMLVSGLIEQEVEDKLSLLSDIMTYFLKSCRQDYKTIVIHENVEESLIRNLISSEGIAVILQGYSQKTDSNFIVKSRVDLVIASIEESVDEVEEVLTDFSSSFWWDNVMPYFILSSLENGCQAAKAVLKTVWKKGILNCYYVCFDFQETFVYTFNPYSIQAPFQWKVAEEISNERNYMAIYYRPYNTDNICEEFNFDRTKYLNKMKLKIFVENKNSGLYKYDLATISAMRVVFNVSIVKLSNSIDCYNEHAMPHLHDNTLDIALCLMRDNEIQPHSLSATYPVTTNGRYIFSKNQRYFSPLEKIYSSFDISLILATLIISLFTYLIILYTNSNQTYSSAILEIIRLWIGNSMNIQMNPQSLRILFSSILIYFLIMQATLQGDLVEFLSKTELRKNANFITDLESDFYYNIYTFGIDKWLFSDDSPIYTKLHYRPYRTSIKAVIEEESSACIVDYRSLLQELTKSQLSANTLQNFHVSKYSIKNYFLAYAIRHRWPLKERFDNFLMRFETTGISDKIKADTTALIGSHLQIFRYIPSFESISIDSLSFVFYFWSVGILLSVFCFILENCILSKKCILKCCNCKTYQRTKSKKIEVMSK